MGAKVEVPDQTARDALDELLVAPLPAAPTPADRQRLELMDALNLSTGR